MSGLRDYSEVRPGDKLIFRRPGVEYGGAVWQSPETGAILAGDTYLTLGGAWLEVSRDPLLTMTLDTSHRREGEDWSPTPMPSDPAHQDGGQA